MTSRLLAFVLLLAAAGLWAEGGYALRHPSVPGVVPWTSAGLAVLAVCGQVMGYTLRRRAGARAEDAFAWMLVDALITALLAALGGTAIAIALLVRHPPGAAGDAGMTLLHGLWHAFAVFCAVLASGWPIVKREPDVPPRSAEPRP